MKIKISLQKPRPLSRSGALCAGIWLLAAQLATSAPAQAIYSTPYTFTTLIKTAHSDGASGSDAIARFSSVEGLAVDSAGNVYVASTQDHTISRITPVGRVTVLAGRARCPGSDDGTGSDARFLRPRGVTVDSAGNVYVADSQNHTIRRVTPTGIVTTVAGRPGDPGSDDGTRYEAQFFMPVSVALDTAGNLYVADALNDTIRKIKPGGVVTTLAGLAGNVGSADGKGGSARFCCPMGVAVDLGGDVYVADTCNDLIRKVTPDGVVTTLAGQVAHSDLGSDGDGSAARFYHPMGLGVDRAGNVFVADSGNCAIRRVTPAGEVTTVAGRARHFGDADGVGSAARFDFLLDLKVDAAGNLYAADTGNDAIRKGTPGLPNLRPLALKSPAAGP